MHIRDVAKSLKMSVATVSRALNPQTSHLVAEKTRRRVQKFVQEVGYVPNRTARELSTGKTRTIGVVLPNVLQSVFFNDYLIKILAGVYRVLEQDNTYNCKIIITPRGKVLSELDNQVLGSGLDGLLLSPYCDHAFYSSHYLPKNVLTKWMQPLVILNLRPKSPRRFHSVYLNHFDAARKAVLHLILKGHKLIAMIKGDSLFPESVDRFDGYRAALQEHGIKPNMNLVQEGNFLLESGYEATLRLFRQDVLRPTAIFCANDEMALGAIRALKSLNIACPREVAVMGFDGIEIGEYVEPRLTTMAQPTHQIAEAATRLLLDQLAGKIKGPVATAVPANLVIRDSV